MHSHSIPEQENTIKGFNKISFDGVNQNLNIGDLLNGARGIKIWFDLPYEINSSFNGNRAIIGRNTSSNNDEVVLYHLAGGKLRFLYRVGSTTYSVDSDRDLWKANEKYFISVDIHNVDGLSMSVNGIKQADIDNTATSAIPSISDNSYLGCFSTGVWHSTISVKKLTVYSEPQTTEEIISEHTYSPTGLELGLIDFHNFTEGDGTNTVGLKGNIGILSSASMWSETPETDYQHIQFSKTKLEYISLGNSVLNDVRCIQFWAKQETTGGSYINRNQGNAYGDLFVTNVGGYIRFAVYDNTGAYKFINSDLNTYDGSADWVHVSMNFKAGVGMEMYMDGVKQSGTTTYDMAMRVQTSIAYLGRRVAVNQYASDNAIKGLKLWTVHRDEADVKNDMSAIPDGTEVGLKAYYPMLQLEGNKIYDFKGNYEGTLSSTGSVDAMWVKTDPMIDYRDRHTHYDSTDADSYSGTGTTLNDLSGNGRNATLVNGVTQNPITKGLVLDGVNQYIDTGYARAIPTNVTMIISVESINYPGSGTKPLFASYGLATAGNPVFYAVVTTGGHQAHYIRNNPQSASNGYTDTSSNLGDGEKYVVAMRKKGNDYTYFRNGVIIHSFTQTIEPVSPDINFLLGVLPKYPAGTYLNGEISKFIDYEKASTNKEIVDITNNFLNK